ncbi:hypothetical protein [Agrobacterium vitis]|uniref:hypothetical protein n=1 Tax=Agrobacterium vitis TaxID=373 RepID=UPI003D28641E
MVDFTSVNPTKNSFKTGTNINQPYVAGILIATNPEVGKGILQTFIANQINANGNYDRLGQSGTITISVTPQGSAFNFTLGLTGGGSSYSRSFLADGRQVDATTVQLTQQGGDLSVTFSQNNGSIFTDGKIEIGVSWAPMRFYIDSNV